MFNFLFGLIAGVAFAALFGWMNLSSKELAELQNENATLKAAHQEISTSLKQAQDESFQARTLAQPAKRVGVGSSRATRESGLYR